MSEELSERLQRAYARRRRDSEIRRAVFRERLAEEDSQLREMEDERRREGLSKLLRAFGAEADGALPLLEAEKLKDLDEEVEKRYRRLEKEAAFSPWHCPLCEDSGLVGSRRCRCAGELMKEDEARSGIAFPPPSEPLFSAFDERLFSAELHANVYAGKKSPLMVSRAYLSRAKSFVENFPEDHSSFYFFGPTGTGKSWFAAAIGNALRERGFYVAYLRVSAYLDLKERLRVLERSYSADPVELQNARERVAAVESADLLILDDLGSESGSGQSYSDLVSLLDQRAQSPVPSAVLTGNLQPRAISQTYDERLGSRILRFQLFPLDGPDLRYLMAALQRETLDVSSQKAGRTKRQLVPKQPVTADDGFPVMGESRP